MSLFKLFSEQIPYSNEKIPVCDTLTFTLIGLDYRTIPGIGISRQDRTTQL